MKKNTIIALLFEAAQALAKAWLDSWSSDRNPKKRPRSGDANQTTIASHWRDGLAGRAASFSASIFPNYS
jgi:hypothetical protein